MHPDMHTKCGTKYHLPVNKYMDCHIKTLSQIGNKVKFGGILEYFTLKTYRNEQKMEKDDHVGYNIDAS